MGADAGRRLTVAIDGRELELRPTGVGRWLGGLLRAWLAGPGDERFVLFHEEQPAWAAPDSARLESCVLGRGALRSGTYWQQATLARALAKRRPDVLFAPAESLPWSWRGAAVVVFHDLAYFARPEWFGATEGLRRRWLARFAAARARRIVAVSEFTRAELGRHLAVPERRIDVVPHGVDEALLATVPTPEPELRARIGFEHPFALVVGSVFERRRPDEVLDAFARLTDLDLGLVLVGDDRRRRRRGDLDARIANLGLGGRATWLGYAGDADLAGLYRIAHHALCVSDYEGFGLPALEAMAFGVPVIVSRSGGLGEVHANAALALERNEADCIAAAVRRLAGTPGLRDELRARGLACARRASAAASAARTLELLRAAAER